MTGYGQGSAQVPGLQFTIELRTVNNRFSDLRLRLPQGLSGFEKQIRRTIQARIKRGRIEMTVRVVRDASDVKDEGSVSVANLDRDLAEALVTACRTLKDDFGVKGDLDLSTALGVPGLFRQEKTDIEWGEVELAGFTQALEKALDTLEEDRAREGEQLQGELLQRMASMDGLTVQLRSRLGDLPDALRTKLVDRLKILAGDLELDPIRIAQEAVYLADRSDVTEEIVRLEGHLAQFRTLLQQDGRAPVGKRLEFLLQEILRETNTINSKPADLELSRMALELKAETEKVREQIQNIE
jgi:uncharacterized protein (TIGR00255 family)